MDDEPGFLLLSAIVELELGGQALSASWSERLVEAQPHNFTARRLLAAANWADADSEGAAEALAPIVARADADSWSLLLAARRSAPAPPQIGRAHVGIPVPNAHLVCRLLLEKKKTYLRHKDK